MAANSYNQAATKALSSAVAASRYAEIPKPVAMHALRTFVNFVGCAVGGAKHEAVDIAERAISFQSGGGSSCVIGRPGRTAPLLAALMNGVAGAVNAFDDTHSQAVVHPGSPVGAALVALATSLDIPVSGETFLTAYTWGVELACRVSMAVSVAPAEGHIGWSQTGISAPVGAAAACARLLSLNEQQTTWAVDIAATLSSGLRVANGSMAMHLLPARAAVAGLEAALFAWAGLTGPENALEGRYGHLELFAKRHALDYLCGELGTRFEILKNTFKPYPCGIVIHAAIDACLALSSTEGLCAAEIREVTLEVSPLTIALTDKPHPADVFSAQVSVQHWAAAALIFGEAGLKQAALTAITDERIRAVREKCRLVRREDFEADAAIATLHMMNGTQFQASVTHCFGSLCNPLGDEALSHKFLMQSTPVLGERDAINMLERCWTIPADQDVRTIWQNT